MEAGTEALPRGITHHPDVLRRYFYDRVFRGEWNGPIRGPEGDNMTKHNGRFVSLKALRDQVLKDIEDLVAFMTVPVGESTRSAMYRRTPEARATMEGEAFGGQSAMREPFVPHYLPGINSKGYRYSVREEKQPATHLNASEGHLNQPSAKELPNKKPASQNIFSRGQDRFPDSPSHQPFSEKLKSIEIRQPFLEQLQRIEDRAPERSTKESLSEDVRQQSKVKDNSLGHVTSETSTSTLKSQHIKSPYTTSNQHRSSTKESPSPSHKSLAASSTGTMQAPTLAEIFQQPLSLEDRQAVLDGNIPPNLQHSLQAFGYQLPQQHQLPRHGIMPNSMSFTHGPHDSWNSPPQLPMHQLSGYQQPTGGFYQSQYVAPAATRYPTGPLPMPLGFMQPSGGYPPLSHGPPPPSRGQHGPSQYADYPPLSHGPPPPSRGQQGPLQYAEYPPLSHGPPPPSRGQQGPLQYADYAKYGMLTPLEYGPPPPGQYANIAVRPPSSTRVAAQVYRNDPAFQYNGLPQVRGTPTPLHAPGRATPSVSGPTQQFEWQHRYGLVPVFKPDIPVLAYRPGSDDMRPHATAGAQSVPYQELTRNTVPSFEDVKAPENMPFAEIAKESKPPSWGVLKIGNVSTQTKDKDPAKRILKRPDRP